ncbi:MAG: ABC transporter permease subunit [Acetobacteraceae bacterium]|nr:ABC transporter permease subunit [Acetobacteraceae bacterium]
MTFLAPIVPFLPDILQGLLNTLGLWVAGSVLALVLGLLLAVARHFGGTLVRAPVTTAVGVVRATPFLIQLFLLYYGGPFIGLSLDPIPAGLLGLGIYGGAYVAEILRGGLEAVPRGHLEAASCLGLSRAQAYRRIVLPEIGLLVLPAMINMAIVLLKETAVLSVVTVPELTMAVTAMGAATFAYAQAAFLLALAYWALTEATGHLGRWIEARAGRLRLAT